MGFLITFQRLVYSGFLVYTNRKEDVFKEKQ